MEKSILKMSRKAVELERINLISEGYLSDSCYYIDELLIDTWKILGKNTGYKILNKGKVTK